MQKIKFSEEKLGFFQADKDAFSAYLGVNRRTLDNWISEGLAPLDVAEKLERIRDLALFPLDDFPDQDVLGAVVFRSYLALRQGDEELAEALTAKAFSKKSLEWSTGKVLRLTPLQRYYAELINAIAWTRNTNARDSTGGLLALRRLRRRIWQTMAESDFDEQASDREAWFSLRAIADAYWLSYFVDKLGRLPERDARRKIRLARRVAQVGGRLAEYKKQYRRQNLSAFVAWSLARHAAAADHEALFYESTHILREHFGKSFPSVREVLRRDTAVAAMLKRPRMSTFNEDRPLREDSAEADDGTG